MRFTTTHLVILGAASILTCTWASAEVSPISIQDAVMVVDPSLSVSVKWLSPSNPACGTLIPGYEWICTSAGQIGGSAEVGDDALGQHYSLGFGMLVPDTVSDTTGVPLQRIDNQGRLGIVAYLLDSRCRGGVPCSVQDTFRYGVPGWTNRFAFDVVKGAITLGVYVSWNNTTETQAGIIQISGLPGLFDTFLTYLPSTSALRIVPPAIPDGFRSADSLQVWTGNVRSMPDWSQAQPLACMAAQNPTPGQIVSVADTLPDPPVGQGRYYLTASVNGPDRRLGRQYSGGQFSARNPMGLPACVMP